MIPAGLAQEATRLLLRVAAGDQQAADAYDELLFEPLLEHVAQRGHVLALKAARLTGTDRLGVPSVGPGEMDEVAHDVAVEALRTARRRAGDFQPGRGDGASWAFRAAAFAYVDVLRARTGSRRQLQQVPTDADELIAVGDAASQEPGPAVRYEVQEALDRALALLDPDERKAVLLHKQYGYSYAEIARLLLGDVHAVHDVDRLVSGGVRKIRRQERRFREGRGDT